MKKTQIKRVAVIGTGMMGPSIAQEFAQGNFGVTLCGRSPEKLKGARLRIAANLREMNAFGLISKAEIEPALDHLKTTTTLGEGVADADLIVEAIVEDLDIKRDLFCTLEDHCPSHAIIASNTSSIMPSLLASRLKHPERFLVAHYFNPPHLMPLVEIVPGAKTYAAVVEKVYALYLRLGKKPIKCLKEAPGFIANRIQLVIWREAFNIVQKGIATPQDVDQAVKFSFGRRFGVAGPFEIYEHNDGYDLTLQCEKYMLPDMDTSQAHYDLLLAKVGKGELGAKSGRGFYEWTAEYIQKWRSKMYENLVAHRRKDLAEKSREKSP